jgi:hypothetical protein
MRRWAQESVLGRSDYALIAANTCSAISEATRGSFFIRKCVARKCVAPVPEIS